MQVLYEARLTPTLPDCPPTLTLEQEEATCQLIRKAASTGNLVTQRKLLNFIEIEFRKILTYGWVKSFLHRKVQDVKQVWGSPQELPRLQIPQQYLNEYITLIQEYVPLVPAEFVFHLDEIGLSDWEERKRQPILIPVEIDGDAIHYRVDRRIRHQTLVCCISAAGGAYYPLLTPSDASARSVFEMGVRDGTDLRIQIAPSSYITVDIFRQYL
jgi:hypothetical protein